MTIFGPDVDSLLILSLRLLVHYVTNGIQHQVVTVLIYRFACLGPDICGPGTKKVHVIFNYKGKNHLINKDVRCKVGESQNDFYF